MKYSDGKPYKTVALCLAKYNGIDQTELIKSLYSVCLERNMKLFVFASSTDFIQIIGTESEMQVYNLLEPEKFDAVVLMSDTIKSEMVLESIVRRCLRSRTPCISLIQRIEGCINIDFDFSDSFESVVRHVIGEHEVNDVNFIAGIKGNPFSDERLNVFRRVMAEYDLPVEEDRIGYGNFWETPTVEVMQRFLSSGKNIDAIICANDFMAIQACEQLRLAGIRVPEDVIVSGFDGIEMEKYHYPRLTTAFHDTNEICEKVADIIEDSCNGISVSKEYHIKCKFRKGQSCGCVSPDYIPGGNVRKFGHNTYEAYKHLRRLEGNIEVLYGKYPTLTMAPSLADTWGEFEYMFQRFFPGADMNMLINDDFVKDDLAIWPSLSPFVETGRSNYYTDEMRLTMLLFDGQFKNGLSMERRNLAYNLDDMLNKDGCMLFVPLNCQSSAVGYVAARINPQEFDFFLFLVYINNIISVFDSHKSRLDQQTLFSIDQLTRLLNRKGFYLYMNKRVLSAIENKIPVSVISVDLNGLKGINDTYGHKEGDFALSKIGEFLGEVVGEKGVATRFGGDEFAAAFVGDDALEKARDVAAEMNGMLEEFNATGEKKYQILMSYGIAGNVLEDASMFERLFMEADKKLYRMKEAFKKEHPEMY